jgi:hypothetical protein
MWIETDDKAPTNTSSKTPNTSMPESKPLTNEFSANAVPVDKMPDVYDLYDSSNKLIGRGSVQAFSISQILRNEKNVRVDVRWNKDFNGYEIFRKSSV